MEDLYKGVGPDRMFLSYAVEVNSYNKVTMVDDLAALALRRLRQLGRLSREQRKADADTLTRFAESLAQISSFFASLPSEMRRKLSGLVTLETFFINEEICAQRDACDRFYFVLSGTVQCVVQENPYAPLTSKLFTISQGVNATNTSNVPAAAAASAMVALATAATAATSTPQAANASTNGGGMGGNAALDGASADASMSEGNVGPSNGTTIADAGTDASASAPNAYGVTTIEEGGARQVAVLQAGDCFGAVSLETEMAGRKSACASLFARSKCEIFTLSAPYYKVTLHKEIKSRVVERLAFLRRLKLLRNVPIEELAAFSHVVGTAVLSNRLRDSVMTTSNGRMHIIVEGECTMHLNRYSSSSSSSSSSSTSSSISAALGLSPTDSSKAGNKKSGEAKKKEDIERTLGGAGPRYSTDNATIIARFGPGSVFWESAIFKDFRHDWHVIIRSATLRTYCIHRNDWNLLRYDADGTGVPIVSDKIKRSFRDEARFKMNYYTARAGTIADKIDVGARGNESSSSVAAGKSLS